MGKAKALFQVRVLDLLPLRRGRRQRRRRVQDEEPAGPLREEGQGGGGHRAKEVHQAVSASAAKQEQTKFHDLRRGITKIGKV